MRPETGRAAERLFHGYGVEGGGRAGRVGERMQEVRKTEVALECTRGGPSSEVGSET